MDSSIPILALAGPTASGKTALALELCRRIAAGEGGLPGAEIVSVDSAQVYCGMDIGTAKPDAAIRERVPHHLIDIRDPSDPYSAARFASDAALCIADIRARGKLPILAGGTLLYFRALFEGLSELPPADPAARARISAEAAQRGWPALHGQLAQIDPATAARLHPNDAQRIQRALEIFAVSGVAPSLGYAARGAQAPPGPLLRFAIVPSDRTALHQRIEARFHEMMRSGFLDEVATLRARGDVVEELPALRAVGYRQLWMHLTGRLSLADAVEAGIAASRQYAKRQLTWLRSETQWRTMEPSFHGNPGDGNGTESASEILRALEDSARIAIRG